MEPNGLGGGIFSGIGTGMLGLEMPLHQQQNPTNPPNPHQLNHPQIVTYAHHEPPDPHPQSQQSIKYSSYAAKPKHPPPAPIAHSDDDEPGFAADDSTGDAKRKISPWQRMKWTDTMVRLLIMAVFYIGDEGGSEATDPTGKKKSVGLLQKKGKWKSVSRAMMEKGFYVSPQQCEDKFNDLNKRYKRVNDILGKGTACRVVENQSLLDTMDLTPKMKDEVRKLLNSKHLFFREMCAYHNSCGHGNGSGNGGGGGASAAHNSTEMAAEPSHVQQSQQQRCFHSSENVAHHLERTETEGSKMGKVGSGEDDEDDEEDDDSEEDDDDDDDVVEGGSRGHDYDEENDERNSNKRPRKNALFSPTTQLMQRLSGEIMGMFQDDSKSQLDKKQWMKNRLIQLEEQQVNYQYQSFELEKQRLKWVKFSNKKERDMERERLENERCKLQNERMVLLIRQKELELFDLHQQQHSSNKRGDPSSITG